MKSDVRRSVRPKLRLVMLALVLLSPIGLAGASSEASTKVVSQGDVRCDLEAPNNSINCDEKNRFDHIIVINTTGRRKVTAVAEWTANSAESQEMQFRVAGNPECRRAGQPFSCYDQTIRGASPLQVTLEGTGASDPTMGAYLVATPYSCEFVGDPSCARAVHIVRNQGFTVTWTLE
jgi:hypothetical protein